jgi:hypothetical protein
MPKSAALNLKNCTSLERLSISLDVLKELRLFGSSTTCHNFCGMNFKNIDHSGKLILKVEGCWPPKKALKVLFDRLGTVPTKLIKDC